MSLAAVAMAAKLLSASQDGHWTGRLDGGPKAAEWRETEVRVLRDENLRSLLDQLDVELISYRALDTRA